MKLDTVNVIEYNNDEIIRIDSFSDDKEGNVEAEELFSKMAKENGAIDADLENFALDDGYYERGTYQLFLTHSCKGVKLCTL